MQYFNFFMFSTPDLQEQDVSKAAAAYRFFSLS